MTILFDVSEKNHLPIRQLHASRTLHLQKE